MNKKLGLGLTVINDKMGPRNTLGASANVAYIIKIDRKTKLSFGLNAGYNRYQFAFSKLTFNSTEVPANFGQDQSLGVLDLGAGMYLRGSGFFIGISASHLNMPTVYDYVGTTGSNYSYQLGSHLFITAGKSFIINNDMIFAPTIMLKGTSGAVTSDINLNMLLYKRLWLGVFYRTAYGPGALLQFYVTNALKVGYSYDSGLKDARRLGGSHEVMIGFEFLNQKSKMINPRFL
jgi:type IX secretion system PorP/SprF family membrane protein